MQKLIIILGIVLFATVSKSQMVDTVLAIHIQKEVVESRTGATYSDSLYVVVKPNGNLGFPDRGKVGVSVSYDAYWDENKLEPITTNSYWYLGGYPEDGASAQ